MVCQRSFSGDRGVCVSPEPFLTVGFPQLEPRETDFCSSLKTTINVLMDFL